MAFTLVSKYPNRSVVAPTETIRIGVNGETSAPQQDAPYILVMPFPHLYQPMEYIETIDDVLYYEADLSNAQASSAAAVTIYDNDMRTILAMYTITNAIVNPTITALEVVRCLSDGTESDEGTYLLIKSLKLSINADTSASAITTAEITVGTIQKALSASVIEAALSSAGYSESTPGIFAGETFLNGTTYAGALTIGTAYEQATYSFTVPRDFVNFDLAGAATGGVAIGMFSNSTLNNPMFECAYPAYFYGGIAGVTSYAAAETPTGGVWLDNKPIYRRVFTYTTTGTGLQSLGTITGLDTVVKIEGVCKSSSNWLPITYAFTSSGGSVTQARAYVSLAGEVSASFSGSGSKTFIVVVYYTKT